MIRSHDQERSWSLSCRLDVIGTGFAVLDRVYAEDRGLLDEQLGGSCGNVLLSLAMLNRAVAPLLSLGADEVGARIYGAFESAGAETRFISRRVDRRTPILIQYLDANAGRHWFSFTCPESEEPLPRYVPIDSCELEQVRPVLSRCAVFYTDRVSEEIVLGMEEAANAGAIVYFEPSSIGRIDLFVRALRVTSILKFSEERLGDFAEHLPPSLMTILIVTHGAKGLELRKGGERCWHPSVLASEIRDTCGAGDMVTVGVIDWLLERRVTRQHLDLGAVTPGVWAGQRLAAENCAYAGARGLFLNRGAGYARSVLDNASA